MFEAPSILFAAAGAAVFVAAILPKVLRKAPFSMPMVFLGAGIAAFSLIPGLPDPDPVASNGVALHLAEVCVIISLMGAGLALDRPVGRKSWSTTWRLLGIAMPLCIITLTFLGLWFLGLGLGAALLVASSLAPTDPVLASEVQVGEPADEDDEAEKEDEVRFGLTSEAGLNDGLAFPFVYLAIAISVAGASPSRGSRNGSASTCSGGWARACCLVSVRARCWPCCSSRPGSRACGSPTTPKASWPWQRRAA